MKFIFVDFQKVQPYTTRTPLNAPLGGTQSAICYYVSELSNQGHQVILVNGSVTEAEEDGVSIKPIKWYYEQRNHICDVMVLCGAFVKEGLDVLESNFIYTLSVGWQGHYGFETAVSISQSYIYYIDVFAFVSEYQRNQFCRVYQCPIEKTMLMLNGASPPFHKAKQDKTDTFVYCSNPTRGLGAIPDIWKEVIKVHPRAKLEIFSSEKTYGVAKDSDSTLNIYNELRSLPNVTIYESVGQRILAEHCGKAAFLLYPTHFVETSCIVCIETSTAGVIPIVPDLGVFPEYVDSCVRYCEDITPPFAKRANELLNLYYDNRSEFDKLSKTLSTKTSTKHNYTILANTFLKLCKTFIVKKGNAIVRLREIESTFMKRDPKLAIYVGESMPLFFESKIKAALFFLWQGNNMMNCPYFNSAEYYFLQSNSIIPSSSACNNLIIYYEKIENYEKLFHWFFTSLKYGFNFVYAKKVLKLLSKLELFEQIAFLSNIELLYKYTTDAEQFLFYVDCMNMLSQRLRTIMQHERALNLLRNVFQQVVKFPTESSFKRHVAQVIGSNIMFTANYSIKDINYLEDCLNYERHIPLLIVPEPITSTANPKIRIGFISGDFVNHPVTYILNGFVQYIDKTKYEVFTFNDRHRKSNVSDSFTNTMSFVKHIQIDELNVAECVKVIRENDIDVLVDMCGHTSSSTVKLMDVIRAKPAKVICSYFAYPNTTGLKAVDFKLGDETTLPSSSKSIFTEEFQHIKSGLHCYKAPSNKVSAKRPHVGVVFGVFNNPQKLSIDFLQTVVTIMKKVHDSIVIFSYNDFQKKGTQDFYKTTLESLGLESNRVQFKIYNTVDELGDVYNDIDISLDTFPYNGGTISIESLHYSTPYISLLGDDYVSRVGASILKQVNHSELIATTKEDYIDKVVNLAKDSVRLAGYHKNLLNDLQISTLENGAKFAVEFEHAMKEMLVKKGFQVPPEVYGNQSIVTNSIQEKYMKKTAIEMLHAITEKSEPTLTIQPVQVEQSSKKYMLCIPGGGICDMIFVISYCLEYAIKNNRTLIIDTTRIDWFKESIHDFIAFNHPLICIRDPKISLRDIRPNSIFPEDLNTHHLCDFPIYVNYKDARMQTENRASLTIDLSKSYKEDIIVYCFWADSKLADVPNRFDITPYMKFKTNVLSVFRERRKLLPKSYVSFHIRNTDHKSDVSKFVEEHDHIFKTHPCFLASDNKQNIEDIKDKYCGNVYNFSKIEKYVEGAGLHHITRTRDELISLIIDSYADLLLLASGDEIYISTRKSRFSLYAEYLLKHKQLLSNLINSPWSFFKNVYVISLKEDIARRAAITSMLSKFEDLTFTIIDAIKGADNKDLRKSFEEKNIIKNFSRESDGVFGCLASHRMVWEHSVYKGLTPVWTLILEDDACFHPLFSSDVLLQYILTAPADAKCLKFGFLATNHFFKHYSKINECWWSFNGVPSFSTICYAIRSDSVIQMLNHIHVGPVDSMVIPFSYGATNVEKMLNNNDNWDNFRNYFNPYISCVERYHGFVGATHISESNTFSPSYRLITN